MTDREHVTFRPGELAERLFAGPLSAGATAKRDLIRYYAVLDARFDDWWNANQLWEAPWDVIVDFVEAQGWDAVPTPADFLTRFEQFLKSPLASRIERGLLRDALDGVRGADEVDVVAILDRAEREIASAPQPPAFPDEPTAGATSAA
jgi:hypothetical protein